MARLGKRRSIRGAQRSYAQITALVSSTRDDPDSLTERLLRLWNWRDGTALEQDGASKSWLKSWRKAGFAARLRLPWH